jgi:Tol biopolymer transport system component
MDATGANLQRLTQTPGEATGSYWPDWSPDGTQITFASNRDGNFEIYVMNSDGSNVRRLTFNQKGDRHPDW